MKTLLSPYPRGWFVVAGAHELAPGGVLSMHYFGQQLVAFRGESGEVSILDAYCPHLGADLGVGGTVVGDTIRCPFHAWRYDAAGTCVEIPYAKKIPPKACVRAWPVRERNGLIFLWHCPRGDAPDWEIPVIAEYGATDWTDWSLDLVTIKTQPREIVENVADKGHFPEVHGTHVDRFDNEFVDHMAIQRTEGVAYPRGGGKDEFKLTATYYGPSYQITEMESLLPNRLLNCHVPIDEHRLHLRFGVMLKMVAGADKMERFVAQYIENLKTGFHEDIAIWENKKWRDRPMLCDGDGAIGLLRKWYRQFYIEADATGARDTTSTSTSTSTSQR